MKFLRRGVEIMSRPDFPRSIVEFQEWFYEELYSGEWEHPNPLEM
jgi:hypothetical protein